MRRRPIKRLLTCGGMEDLQHGNGLGPFCELAHDGVGIGKAGFQDENYDTAQDHSPEQST